MNDAETQLLTPIYLKTDQAREPSDDTPICYVLTGDGLFVRRNHPCFEVPDQRATVSEGWNGVRYPTDVRYETPQVGADLSLFGSVHSHVDGPAYSSNVDRNDESYLTGLHIVVGRISREPPDIHCEYVVDGVRFRVDTRAVIEGYHRRDTDIPNEWIKRVKAEVKSYEHTTTYYDGRYDRGPARRKVH